MYRLIIGELAKQELENEVAYSLRNWGNKQAKKYRQGLTKTIKELRQNAKIYQVKAEFAPDIRIVRYKGSQIIYRLNEQEKLVSILAIYGKNKEINPADIAKRDQ